jgi:hypothetical protein
MKAAMYSLCLVALAGCATESSRGLEYRASEGMGLNDVAVALDKAEAQWVAAGATKYSFHIRRGGVFGGSVYKVIYRGGSCRATHLKDIGLPSSFACERNSIPQLFAEIRNEVASANSDISLSLDSELGYVHWFSVEPHTDLTDQGWGAEISHFKVLK